MKNLIIKMAMAVMLTVALALPASAFTQDWDFDLQALGYSATDFNVANDIEYLSFSGGQSTVYQELSDGDFDLGLGYSETFEIPTFSGVSNNNGYASVQIDVSNTYSIQLRGYLEGEIYEAGYNEYNLPIYRYNITGWQGVSLVVCNAAGEVVKTLMTFDDLSGIGELPETYANFTMSDFDVQGAIESVTAGLITLSNGKDLAEYVANGWSSAYISLTNTMTEVLASDSEHFQATFSSLGDLYIVATPEPSTFMIFGLGIAGLALFRRKFQK